MRVRAERRAFALATDTRQVGHVRRCIVPVNWCASATNTMYTQVFALQRARCGVRVVR